MSLQKELKSESVISFRQFDQIIEFVKDIDYVVTQIRSFINGPWDITDLVKTSLINLRRLIKNLLEKNGGKLAQFIHSLSDVYKGQNILTYNDETVESTEVTVNQRTQKKLISIVLNDISSILKKIKRFKSFMAGDIDRLDVSNHTKQHLLSNHLIQPTSEYYMKELSKITVSMNSNSEKEQPAEPNEKTKTQDDLRNYLRFAEIEQEIEQEGRNEIEGKIIEDPTKKLAKEQEDGLSRLSALHKQAELSRAGGTRRILRNIKSKRYRGNRNLKQLLHSKKSNNIFRRRKSIKIKKSRKPRKYKKTKKNKRRH
jgi:hypothetical protein